MLRCQGSLQIDGGCAVQYVKERIASRNVYKKGSVYAYLEYGTLILTLISRCAPFVDGLLFAAIVDTLLLSAAIVQHHDTDVVRSVPQCIPAHNCDTKKTMLRLMAFLDLCIVSTRWSLLCSR